VKGCMHRLACACICTDMHIDIRVLDKSRCWVFGTNDGVYSVVLYFPRWAVHKLEGKLRVKIETLLSGLLPE
jgi:hypothetical protein